MEQLQIRKPMLASPVTDFNAIRYPVEATPKFDGIRSEIVEGQALSRNFKPIPNNYIRQQLEMHLKDGYDGELLLKDNMFNWQAITSAVMSEDGKPNFVYVIFDKYSEKGYLDRMEDLRQDDWLDTLGFVKRIFPVTIRNEEELLAYEQKCLKEGYEGIMIRSPNGLYKFGRSTEKEGYLLKIKRFEDGEAVITGVQEQMENTNVEELDKFGHTVRSSAKAGMVPKGTLGSIDVKDLKTDVEFNIGTGFDDSTRHVLWNSRDLLIGKIVKYKYQKVGVKTAPRFPVFLGFRDPRDMS